MMAKMPLSIPMTVKVKGLKKLTTMVAALQTGMESIMTSAEQISADLTNTREGVASLLTAAETAASAQAALQAALDAALADQGAAVEAAVTAAVANERATAEAALGDLRTQADELANFTPDAPAAPVDPDQPQEPVDPNA